MRVSLLRSTLGTQRKTGLWMEIGPVTSSFVCINPKAYLPWNLVQIFIILENRHSSSFQIHHRALPKMRLVLGSMNSPCVPLHSLGLSPHSCLCCRLKSRALSLNNSLKRTLHAQLLSASDPLKAVQPLPQKLLVPPLTPCSHRFPAQIKDLECY